MARNSRLTKFQRVTALFDEGREVVLEEDGDDGPVLVWVNKLNPFEQEEARKDGSVGRARAILMLDDPMSPELAVFQQRMEGSSVEQIVEALAYAKQNEDYVEVLDDLRSDEAWKDKLLVLERGDTQLLDAAKPMDDEEAKALASLNQEYMAEIEKRLTEKVEDRKKDLSALSEDELHDLYREQYRDAAGSSGFLTEYKVTEMYYALRDCQATSKRANGRWDHTSCDHRQKLCDSRSDIRQLPEGLIAVVRDAMAELAMSPREAGNSDAPASSSASSEQPSAPEAASPSTPVATSPGPDGTSSQPSQ